MNMEKKFKSIIVDDEDLARNDLKMLLSKFPAIEVVGEADNITSAVQLIEKTNPNLIFLDIQFPGETGFDLLNKIEIKSKIIFVTAYDEYAIRAFEVNAQDYLLKPVNPQRLAHTLERIEEDRDLVIEEKRKFSIEDSVFLEVNSKWQFIKITSIIKISSSGNYSEISTINGVKGLTTKSLKEWEIRLPESAFIRIHRSTIINIDYIEKVEPWFNYSYSVHLKGLNEPEVMSRRYVSKIKDRMT
jgi:two-component system, LytTR family, response regulator